MQIRSKTQQQFAQQHDEKHAYYHIELSDKIAMTLIKEFGAQEHGEKQFYQHKER